MIVGDQRREVRSIVSDSTETLFLRIILYIVGFGASVIISRGLGPEGRGEYYLPVVAAATMVSICKLGLEQANVFLYGTQHVAMEKLSAQNGLVSLTMGGIGLGLLLFVPVWLPGLFSDTAIVFLLLAGSTIPFSIHTQFSAGLLTIQGNVTWQFRAALLAGLVQFVLLLGVFLIHRESVGVVLGIHLVTVAITWALTVWPLSRVTTKWIGLSPRLLLHSLRHSILLHVGMILLFLQLRIDMFMVKGMIGASALGLYSLAVVLAETILLATDSLAIAILPRQMKNTLQEAACLALKGARINAMVAIGLIFLWIGVGSVVIRIFFGEDFVPTFHPLVALAPGMVFLGMQRVCGGPLLRTGNPGKITTIYAVSLVCNILLNLWWIPLLGIVGAGLASTVAYALGAFLFLGWTAILAGVSLAEAIIPRKPDVVALRQGLLDVLRILLHGYLVKKQIE